MAAPEARPPQRARADDGVVPARAPGLAAGRALRRVADAARQGAAGGRRAARHGRGRAARRLGRGHLVPGRDERAPAAPLPRQGDDRARGARGAAPGQGRDDRPPGAARVPRPALGAPQPGVRARPHVHVGLLDLRLAAAPRRRDRDPGPRASRARAARAVRRPHRADLELAARRRAQRRGRRRVVGPDRAPSLLARGQRSTREGSACRADRRAPDPRAARGVGDLVPPGGAGAPRERPLAGARVGGLRGRLRRRDRVRDRGPSGAARDGAARARGRIAAVGVRERRCRRDRLPARDLDRRLAAPRLARGLRGLRRRVGGSGRSGADRRGHPAGGRVLRLSGHRATRAGGREPDAAPRLGDRARRRERRGQEHARQAALQALRAHGRPDPGGRRAARARARRRLARAARRRLPGLLPLRAARPPERGRGRREAPRRCERR